MDSFPEKDVGAFWLEELKRAEKAEEPWINSGKKVIELYRKGRADASEMEGKAAGGQFNILHANTETLRPAIFQHAPQPICHRRAPGRDTVSDYAAEVMQETVTNQTDDQGIDHVINAALYDYLLPGRAVIRLAYEYEEGEPAPGERIPVTWADNQQTFLRVDTLDPVSEEDVFLDEQTGMQVIEEEGEPTIAYERVDWVHVHWMDFRCSPADRWEDVTWVAFRSRPTKKQAEAFFGAETAERMKFGRDRIRDDRSDEIAGVKEQYDRAEVWEIWDKATRKVFHIDGAGAQGGDPLMVRDAPLKLRGFFPMARPLNSMAAEYSTLPAPEYQIYQDQAYNLNRLTRKIRILERVLRVKILIPGSESQTLRNKLFADTDDDAEIISVPNWAQFQQAGGIDRAVWFMPIDTIVATIESVMRIRDAVKQEVYEITGVSDILRGASKASETATAQNIKRQFASLRIDERRRRVSRWIADTIRIHAEIAAEEFEPETLLLASGVEVPEELAEPVIDLLRDDVLRRFKIDVETNSTVEPHEIENRETITQAVTAVTQFITNTMPLVQTGVMPFEMMQGMLRSIVSVFPNSRRLERMIDDLQPPPPPQQEPSEIEQKLALQGQKAQADFAIAQMKSQATTRDQQIRQMHDAQQRKLDRVAQIMQNASRAA